MGYPTSARFQQALRTAGTPLARIDVTWPGGLTEQLPFSDGSVSVDSGRAVRRELRADVPDAAAWREITLGGATLRPYLGFHYPGTGGEELLPLGVFEVRATSEDDTGMTPGSLTAPDRWRRVQRTRLYEPLESRPRATTAEQWFELVRGAFPPETLSFQNELGQTGEMPHMVWERDRAQAATDIALGLGAEGFFDVLGDARLRAVPAIVYPPAEPAWLVDVGETGVYISSSSDRSDENAYSAVKVSPARMDGLAPFDPVLVEDLNPDSPTYVLGPFGRVPYFITLATITDSVQARVAAEANLRSVTGNAASLSLTSLVNPALEAGDTVEVLLPDGRRQRHVVDAVTIPLGVEQSMAIKTRAQVPLTAES